MFVRPKQVISDVYDSFVSLPYQRGVEGQGLLHFKGLTNKSIKEYLILKVSMKGTEWCDLRRQILMSKGKLDIFQKINNTYLKYALRNYSTLHLNHCKSTIAKHGVKVECCLKKLPIQKILPKAIIQVYNLSQFLYQLRSENKCTFNFAHVQFIFSWRAQLIQKWAKLYFWMSSLYFCLVSSILLY